MGYFLFFLFFLSLALLIPSKKITALFRFLIQKNALYYITWFIGISFIFIVAVSLYDFKYVYFIRYIVLLIFSYLSVFLIVYYWFEYKHDRKILWFYFLLSFVVTSIIWVTISHDSYYDGMEREIEVQNKIINNIIEENSKYENLNLLFFFRNLPAKHWLIVTEQNNKNEQKTIFSTFELDKNIKTLQKNKNKYLWYWDEGYYKKYNKLKKIGNYTVNYGSGYRPNWIVALTRSISFSLSDIVDSKNPNSIQNVNDLVKLFNEYFKSFLIAGSGDDKILGVGRNGNWNRSWNFYAVLVIMLLIIPRFLIEMRKIQREKKELSESKKSLEKEIKNLNKDIDDKENRIKEKDIKINSLNVSVKDKERELNERKDELKKLTEDISNKNKEKQNREIELNNEIEKLSNDLNSVKENIRIVQEEKNSLETEKNSLETEKNSLQETVKELKENNDDSKKVDNKIKEYKEIFGNALEIPVLYQLAFSEYYYDKYKNVKEYSAIIMLGMSTVFEHLLRKIMLGNRFWTDSKSTTKNTTSILIEKYEQKYLQGKKTDIKILFKNVAYIRNDVVHYKENIFTSDNVIRYRYMLLGDKEKKDGVLFVLLNTYKEEEKKNKNNKK